MRYPKGKIVAIGGNEDKGSLPMPDEAHLRAQVRFFETGILKRIHDELHGIGTRIEVITTASHIPEEMAQAYYDSFLLLGCDNVGTLHLQTKEDIVKPENLDRLRKTDAVMFTGGDQRRITEVFAGSQALKILEERYWQEEKFLISGTSAGAMAMAEIMILGAIEQSLLVKGAVELGNGLGFLKNVIIDTHFVNRRRIPRMIESLAANPALIGIGLGEDTAVLITGGNCLETIGSGLVVLFDGRHLKENNYAQLAPHEPLCLENMLMHVLPKGKRFETQSGYLL
ncbi:cyanophycinase [Pontibacter sp. HSC-14F20]|uniref:cyanophycinase n=1 Tax=Pontibacter sp. HSC-14F20 TaxID=2864136 RepID=UPI001C735566|nr:cyanophycinase [Pontibacter sp. HSC-14F20]MBX0332126.1 cyanophycinase [Pontibacter sp. HSC-14F20]